MTSLHSSPSRKIIFFDFDGTLSKGDSGWRFLLFCFRPKDFLRIFVSFFWLLKESAAGRMGKDKFKECCFWTVLKGRSLKEIYHLGVLFSKRSLKGDRLISEMMQRLKSHQAQGDRCILVSASIGEYLQAWALERGFEAVIATRLEKGFDGHATGRFMGKNCYGPQKIKRILKYLKVDQVPKKSVAYGNSAGDFEMLQAVLENEGEAWFVLPNGDVQPWQGLSQKLEGKR